MAKKKKKKKKEKKVPKESAGASARIDARAKEAMAIDPPDENPHFMNNEKKIDRFRPVWKKSRVSRKEANNRANRGTRF